MKAGIETKTRAECCLLACSQWLAQLDFSDNPVHPSRVGTTYSGLGSHTRIINEENTPHIFQHANLLEISP